MDQDTNLSAKLAVGLRDKWLADHLWPLSEAAFQPEYLRDDAVECYMGGVWYAWKGRNAWHNTWSQRYYRNGSFALTFDQAVGFAERNRNRGTVWRIRQLPACAFVTATGLALIVTEISTATPLSAYGVQLPARSDLDSLASMLAPTPEHSTVRLLTRSVLEQMEYRDAAWRGVPNGTGCPFRWDEETGPASSTSSVERFTALSQTWLDERSTSTPDGVRAVVERAAERVDVLVRCAHCAAMLHPRNVGRHERRVHTHRVRQHVTGARPLEAIRSAHR